MKVSRVSEMRAMDRSAIEQLGISAELLMENAGHAVYYALRNEFGVRDKRFLIFCGWEQWWGWNGCDGRKRTSVLENMPENNLSDMITVLKSR